MATAGSINGADGLRTNFADATQFCFAVDAITCAEKTVELAIFMRNVKIGQGSCAAHIKRVRCLLCYLKAEIDKERLL